MNVNQYIAEKKWRIASFLVVLFAAWLLLFFDLSPVKIIELIYIAKSKILQLALKLGFFKIHSFLFFTVFAPILLLFLKMRTGYKLPTFPPPTKLSKQVFYLCLFSFLIIQFYGVYYYKLRMQGDANTDILYYSSLGEHSIPGNYRFAYLLNMFLMLPALKFHLPLQYVGMAYCLNDALFYLTVAGLIILLTQRYDYASAVLAIPVLFLAINFFFIGNALFVSGPLMVLFVAVHERIPDNKIRMLVFLPCLFFVVWSSPVSLFLLAAFIPGLYKSWKELYNDKWVLLFMAVNVVARLLVMDTYDHGKINDLHHSIDFDYIFALLKEYSFTFWFLVLITVSSLFLAIKKYYCGYIYRGLYVLPIALGCCVTNHADFWDVNFTKFLYPINLLLLTHGLAITLLHFEHRPKLIIVLTTFALMGGLVAVFNAGEFFAKRARLLENLNTLCYRTDPKQSKWFASKRFFENLDGYGSYTESMSFSSYQGFPITIQVVRGDEKIKNILDTLPEHKWFEFDGAIHDMNVLNPYYFHFEKHKYKELVLDDSTWQDLAL